uniref:Cadherin domain-containing protein n=1 Tax=Ditylenchus dipsaci TaxID=166011 RepID=A0A915EIC9_9BILA
MLYKIDQLIANITIEDAYGSKATQVLQINLKEEEKSHLFASKKTVLVTQEKNQRDFLLVDLNPRKNQANRFLFSAKFVDSALDLLPNGQVWLRFRLEQTETMVVRVQDAWRNFFQEFTVNFVVVDNITEKELKCPEQAVFEMQEKVAAGTFVGQLEWKDKRLKIVKFKLLSMAKEFLLDEQLGVLGTRQNFHYESQYPRQSVLNLSFSISNIYQSNSKKNCSCLVHVIPDASDHVPSFSAPFYAIEVNAADLSVNRSLLRVEANDTGRNAQLIYRIRPNIYFKINPDTGEIFPLPNSAAENHPMVHNLTIIAVDKSTPAKKSLPQVLLIRVLPDKTRKEKRGIANAQHVQHFIDIPENAPPGFIIKTFEVHSQQVESTVHYATINESESAIDYDTVNIPKQSKFESHQSQYSIFNNYCGSQHKHTVNYSIVDGNLYSLFQINSMTGKLLLVKPLDYETHHNHTLTVLAVQEHSSTWMTMHINVLNVNDNPPQLLGDTFVLPKYNLPGDTIAKLIVHDADDSEANATVEFIYQIPAGEDFLLRGLDLIATNTLDQQDYTIMLLLNDNGQPEPMLTWKKVHLRKDINDTAASITKKVDQTRWTESANSVDPFWFDVSQKVYECDISQFSTVGSEVGRIEVIGASNSSQLQYRQVKVPLKPKVLCKKLLESSSSRNPNVKDGAHLFSIHNLTGVITISKQLDFKKVQLASALVTISSPTTAITAPVYFNILIPYAIRFSKSDLIFQIDENSAVGTFVGWANTGNMGTVHYTIVPYAAEDEPLPFDLDVQSGVLTVKGVLDHEGPFPFYTFQIEAKGSHEVSDIVDVMVVVNDQNDCPPVFENAAREEHNIYYFEASVNEDCLPGCDIFKLEVEDEDLVNKFYYSIDELSDPLGIFDINNDGLLTLTTEGGPTLNYIKQKQHLLKVQLDDDCAPNLYHTIYAYIMVHVVDTNNNAPSFHPTTTTQLLVSESASIGQSIGRVFATDLDGGRNGSVFYRILPASLPHTEFVVDALSGDILVNAALDRESNITHYQFSVEARDGGHPSLRSIQNIRVVVLDEDDHPPNFCNNQTTDAFTISEDALVGHFVGRICYRDSDKGSNQAAIFQIIDGNEDCFFHIDPISGSIFVARPLDFEQFSNHTLDISMTAFSGKYDPIFMKVVINIKNVIDEPPIFMDGRQLFLKVAENVPGLYPVEIRRIEARSQEQYDMSITYSLHQGDASLFHINSSTALLSLLKPLDRELSEEYELVVKARSFARSTSIRVHISVVNVVNNHAPIFTQPFHRLQLQENMTGTNTSILTLKAVDLDEGVNGLVRYFLFNEKDSGEYFWIDPFTGVLGLKHALDAEQYEEMVVQVQAMDSGQLIRQYSDVVEVIVEVLVLNDNAPAIRADLLDVFMPEDARKGDVVYAVDAFDADKTAVLNYFLAGEDKRYFSIDNRGVVTVADVGLPSVLLSGDSFDAVSRPYSLLVTVSDEDGQNATVALKFYTAANELFPVFKKLKSSRVFVLENSTNQLLAHFHSVSSHRHDPIIRYSIAAGDPHSCFHLDSFAGQLFGLTFDREHLGVHHLQIAATILSSPSYTSYMSFTVVVEDVNDNAPRFLQGLTSVEIIENGPPQPNLTTVKANDTDSGVNAKISYSIIAGNTNQVFSIDPVTGAVASLASLDREEVSTYRLVVQAADHGFPSLKSECIVKVEVIDENDNAPKFTRLFHASIREDANLLDFVLQVMSFDPDSPEFSRNSYALLESDGSEDFNIDSLSGKIVVANLLDREKRQQYRLRVRAFDELWSVATSVTIFIEDVNDHVDADKDKNAQLIYFFSTNQFWHSYFYIHPLDGTISVDGKDLKKIEHILTSTRRSMVRLEVIARDSGIPSKHASNFTVVLIRWSEFSNHELPVATDVQSFEIRDCDFGERYVTIWMDEDIKAGTTIYKLDNTNTTSTYHLEHINFNHPVFSVDKDGQVSTLLDSPLRSQSCVSPKMYIVQISSGPSSSATVLRVKKRSKSVAALPIMFLPPRLNYTISAQSTNGTIVGVLRTEEEMPLHQSTMFLMQQKKNAEHLLEIDRKTGEIRLPKNANTTLKASSSGWVIAKNSAYESSFSRSFVNVEFSLDLPAIPTFSQPFYNIFIQESIEHTPVRLVDFQFPLAHTSAKMEITNTAGNEIFCIDTARSTTTLNLCSKPIGLNDIYIVKLAIVEQLNYPVVRSRTTLHVHLNGTLDERKVMESEVCYVMENTPPGQRIFQVPGDGPNSTFRIMDDSLANAFEVDESTGTLLTKKIFDREARELYSLPISVTSSRSTASDRKVVDMRVLIQDADDNPFRPNQPLTLLIYSIEGVFNGMVEQCHAYDSDSVYSSCKEFPLVGGLHGTQSQVIC